MIPLTKLNKSMIYVNPHQIEYVECNPDTTLMMLSGKHLIVRETYPEMYDKIIAYRRLIGAFKNEE